MVLKNMDKKLRRSILKLVKNSGGEAKEKLIFGKTSRGYFREDAQSPNTNNATQRQLNLLKIEGKLARKDESPETPYIITPLGNQEFDSYFKKIWRFIFYDKHNLYVLLTLLIAVFTFFVSFVSFYWYQIRPARIMHACSWVKETLAATPADPGLTEEQATSNLEAYEKCRASFPKSKVSSMDFATFLNSVSMPDRCEEYSVEYKAPTPAQPERVIYKPANKEQYNFCLHDKGLK